MKVMTDSQVKKLSSFLESGEHKVLFYHNDADGICSAALFMKFFEDFDARPRGGPIVDDGFVKEIELEKPELMVFLDLPIDQSWKNLQRLLKRLPELRIAIIDHHFFEKNMNKSDGKRIVHINPMFYSKQYIPASAVVYHLLNEMEMPASPYVWISSIGIVGDYGFETAFCKKILGECKRMYPELLCQDVLESRISEGADTISALTAVKGLRGAEKALEFLLKSRYYKDFSSIKTLEKINSLVKEEMEKVIRRAEAKKKEAGEVIFFPLKSRFGIYQDVANRLARKYPKKIVVTLRDFGGGFFKLSMRNQSGKYNLSMIAKKCSAGIGNGGGHAKAAGAVVNDLKKFKKRLLKEVNG